MKWVIVSGSVPEIIEYFDHFLLFLWLQRGLIFAITAVVPTAIKSIDWFFIFSFSEN
jgi:hypothetical protein